MLARFTIYGLFRGKALLIIPSFPFLWYDITFMVFSLNQIIILILLKTWMKSLYYYCCAIVYYCCILCTICNTHLCMESIWRNGKNILYAVYHTQVTVYNLTCSHYFGILTKVWSMHCLWHRSFLVTVNMSTLFSVRICWTKIANATKIELRSAP
jgi:hypothetical protein